MATNTQRMFLVKVNSLPGYWQTKTGGETSSETTYNWDGGSLRPQVLSGPPTTDNIVVSRAYNYSRDRTIHASLRTKVGRYRSNLTVQPTNEDLRATGRPTVYPNALLVRVSEPDVDSSSGDVAMFELEFAVNGPPSG